MSQTAVVKYDVTDAAIAEMEKLYLGLTIASLDDKDGYRAVHEARMVVKNHRVSVEKRRKELKAEALEWGRKVDAEAKRIKAKLMPIEQHLADQERKIDEEKARIKAEKERRKRELIQSRVDELARYGRVIRFIDAEAMDEDAFADALQAAKENYEKAEAERVRIEGIQSKIAMIDSMVANPFTMAADEIEKIINNLRQLETTPEVFAEFAADAETSKQTNIEACEQALAQRLKMDQEEAERQAEAQRLREEAERLAAEREKIEAEKREIQQREAEKDSEAPAPAGATDADLLAKYADEIEGIGPPVVETERARTLLFWAEERLRDIAAQVRETAKEL